MCYFGDHPEEKFWDVAKPIDSYDHLCAYYVVCFCGVLVFLFGCLVCLCFFLFLFCWHGGSPAPNVDIVRFRCGGGVIAPFPFFLFLCNFFIFFLLFVKFFFSF